MNARPAHVYKAVHDKSLIRRPDSFDVNVRVLNMILVLDIIIGIMMLFAFV